MQQKNGANSESSDPPSVKPTEEETATAAVGEMLSTYTAHQTTMMATSNPELGSSTENGGAPTSDTAVASNVTRNSTTLFQTISTAEISLLTTNVSATILPDASASPTQATSASTSATTVPVYYDRFTKNKTCRI
jgi:hypothetical protein